MKVKNIVLNTNVIMIKVGRLYGEIDRSWGVI